ncbi:hypothetical protein H0H93_010831 [Arthromyces matolae]|nr:hypothetical protein H0H93_010831 [Arthromyces matolae]
MGKWTPDYMDDVLHAKIKSLVSGAIKRAALEKTEPTITYEEFVQELETGDSFTTSIIEVLVKELAERRTRPNVNDDRKLIGDRSAKSLRQLAAPNRIYRDRNSRYMPRRRSATLTDYLSAPPLEMDMEEDEDIFERMLDNGSALEGVRTYSDFQSARRFFPFFRRRYELTDSPYETWSHEMDDSSSTIGFAEPVNAPWFNPTPPATRETAIAPPEPRVSPGPDVETSDERTRSIPRLRRGGLRAPESILSRHASPVPTVLTPHVFIEGPTPSDGFGVSSEPTSYPTPSSTEHEYLA